MSQVRVTSSSNEKFNLILSDLTTGVILATAENFTQISSSSGTKRRKQRNNYFYRYWFKTRLSQSNYAQLQSSQRRLILTLTQAWN